jgi:hypothetical protein
MLLHFAYQTVLASFPLSFGTFSTLNLQTKLSLRAIYSFCSFVSVFCTARLSVHVDETWNSWQGRATLVFERQYFFLRSGFCFSHICLVKRMTAKTGHMQAVVWRHQLKRIYITTDKLPRLSHGRIIALYPPTNQQN